MKVFKFMADGAILLKAPIGKSNLEMLESNRIFEGTNEINRMLSVDFNVEKSDERRIGFNDSCYEDCRKNLMEIPDLILMDSAVFGR